MAIIADLAEFRRLLPPKARLLGLDLGTKTIGLATATLPVGIATPLRTLRRTKFQADARHLMDLIAAEAIAGLVLGLPLNMDGSAGPRVQATRAFARSLETFNPPPILLQDERLSSAEAADAMLQAGTAAARRAVMIDAAAAAVILQDALKAIQAIDPTD